MPLGSRTYGSARSLLGKKLKRAFMLVCRLAVACVLIASAPQFVAAGTGPQVNPAQLKAVYLYNFLHFVTWPPAQKEEGPDGMLTVGIVGSSPVATALKELEQSLQNGTRTPIKVEQFGAYRPHMELRGCRILFVGESERENFRDVIEELQGAPVLTVADSDGFLDAGGMINLLEHSNRIRYQVNRQAAQDANLRLSSQLLNVALER